MFITPHPTHPIYHLLGHLPVVPSGIHLPPLGPGPPGRLPQVPPVRRREERLHKRAGEGDDILIGGVGPLGGGLREGGTGEVLGLRV